MHILAADDLCDADTSWPLVSSEVLAQGKVTRYVRDVVRAPDTRSMTREYLKASQAVGVIAMDDQGHVVVLSQYRHPVRGRLIELPAGLVDVEGEPVLAAAKRELEEEANLAAADWRAVTRSRGPDRIRHRRRSAPDAGRRDRLQEGHARGQVRPRA